ncbi:glycoside hydrolase superfamily [Morchella snyderi]|nr:glycoside hydrolase superfamily [Morchella snyderi]
MKYSTLFTVLSVSLSPVLAQVPVYGQCGGVTYTGSTTCASGSTCIKYSDYYHQCVPGTATTTAAPVTTTTRVTTTTVPVTTTSQGGSSPTASGVVTKSGTTFMLNGKKFYFVGSNSYWLPMLENTADVDKALDDFKASGMDVLRIWGFADLTSSSGTQTAFQVWSGSTPTINTGANGLQRLDYIVAAARARNIRLVIPFVNNWQDYGGMDRYVQSMLGSGGLHDDFYTNANIKAAYKNYVKAVVTRYSSNEPAIFAWQLTNELRCKGTLAASSSCNAATLTNWVNEMSTYIKSLDPTHMVSVGDEGFFNRAGNSEWEYGGGEGVDNEAYLRLPNVDYGTFHLYVSAWSKTYAWGDQWIKDHAAVATSIGKPMVFEEYGVTRSTGQRLTVIRTWHDIVLANAIAGDMYWQFGAVLPITGRTHDDTNTIFTDDAEYNELVVQYVPQMEAKNA